LAPDDLQTRVGRLSARWGLTPDEVERLAALVERFLRTTPIEAANGFQVDYHVRLVVATHACRLLIGLDLDGYDDVSSVIVHASTVVVRGPRHVGGGLMSDGATALSGEAHYRGPVLLSWAAVRAGLAFPGRGEDVVLHEFAHQLDMLDGTIDGTPPLEDADARRRWVDACTAAFDSIRSPGGSPVLRRYGGTNPGEFFAVATEAFFGRPHELRAVHPALYGELAAFYGQDPAARLPVPAHLHLGSVVHDSGA
jgi:Mlc titration factor MtfA (ptsG expression regulator)